MRWNAIVTAVVVGLCLCPEKAPAHEHWIDTENYYPAVPAKTDIFICSGHSFPKSNTVLKDRVLHNVEIRKPDGKKAPYETTGEGKRRSGKFAFESNGVYIVMFELKQPQMKEPLYWAKSIIVAGGRDDKNLYSFEKGLEIVPGGKIAALRKGGTLPLVVRYNGKQVGARLSILPEQGKNVSLSTTAQRPASLSVSHNGRYLVTANYKGKSCSLTFSVRQSGGEK